MNDKKTFYFKTKQDLDDDSEAEKLSPLLVTDEQSPELQLRMQNAEDSVDDTDDVRETFLPSDLVE